MLGFKSFWSTRILNAGIETMHLIREGQLEGTEGSAMDAVAPFYRLAA